MKNNSGYKPISKKNSILLSITSVIIIIGSGFFLFNNESNKLKYQKEQTLSAIASLKVKQIENWYSDELNDADIISSKKNLFQLINKYIKEKSGENNENLKNLLNQIKLEHDYEDIIVAELNGDIINTTNDRITKLEDAERNLIETAIKGSTVATNLFNIANEEKVVLSFISTVQENSKSPEFIIIFRINPEIFLFPIVKNWPLINLTSESYIFSEEQDSIVYLNNLRHIQNRPLEFKASTTESKLPGVIALTGYKGVTEGIDYRGKEVFAYVSEIKGTPWFLVSKIDKDELLSELPKLAIYIASIVLVTILLTIVSVLFFNHQKQISTYKELISKEKDLWQHQEKFKVIMESIGEGVMTIDLSGKVQYLNHRAEELTGWKLRDAKGRAFHSIYNVKSEETGKAENNIMEKVLKEGIIKELANHTILISKNGNELPVMDTGAPMYDSGGKLIGIAIAFQDETERRMQRRKLLESEEKYRSIIETSQDAILINQNNEIVFINSAGIKLFDAQSKDQIIGKSLFDFFHPDFHNIINESVSKIRKGEKIPIIEEKIINLKGDKIDVEVIAVPFQFNGSDAIQVSIRDVNEKKRLVEELIQSKLKAEESNRLKSAFLQNLSHEIRTPMNGIIGFTQLIKDSPKDPESIEEFIDIIEKSGDRLINIINDLVDISKIETGTISVNENEFEIGSMLDELYKLFLKQADEKGLKFEIKYESDIYDCRMISDKTKVYQVLSNLMNNAIKFTESGSIYLGVKFENEQILFYIKDTGIGIPADKQELIFERFLQADTSINRGYEGAGLGLSISKAFVEKFGGKIWVESEVGKGSTFYFSLPCSLKKQSSPVTKNTKSEFDILNGRSKLKVLIVEDDSTSSLLISTLLKPISKEVVRIKNGSEAIEICREVSDFDLILMDLKMPKVDGITATKEIRKINKDVVIIAQTAYAHPDDLEKVIKAGCNDFITKPIARLELYKKIEECFNNH